MLHLMDLCSWMLLLATCLIHTPTASAQDRMSCYRPNGEPMNSAYRPCNQIQGQVSVCCALNTTNGKAEDFCLANGLCQYSHIDQYGVSVAQFWREGCSAKDWNEGPCLKECLVGNYQELCSIFVIC